MIINDCVDNSMIRNNNSDPNSCGLIIAHEIFLVCVKTCSPPNNNQLILYALSLKYLLKALFFLLFYM
jgi:hypothetical protein